MSVLLSQIAVYPVKSMAATHPTAADLVETGLRHDRAWMVVEEDGTFLTQRQHPAMARIAALPSETALTLSVDGGPPLEIPIREDGEPREVRVWDDRVAAVDQGDQAAAFLSDYLGRACRLVRMAPHVRRPLRASYHAPDKTVGFADSAPLLLISEASLADLNGRLGEPVPMDRFRTNLVVAGGVPYQEDTWSRIRIGAATFRIKSRCIRCQIITVDQTTGRKDIEPLETLESYRVEPRGVPFGVKVVHETLGTIRVGDEVEVLE